MPENKSRLEDVDAFLDDIFERALDYNSSQRFFKQKSKAKPKTKLETRIKGGARNKNTINLSVFSNNSEFIRSRQNLTGLNAILSNAKWDFEQDTEYDQIDDNATKANHSFIKRKSLIKISTKDYEYEKIIKTFKLKSAKFEINDINQEKIKPCNRIKYLDRSDLNQSTSALFKSNWNLLSNVYGLINHDFDRDSDSESISTISSVTTSDSVSLSPYCYYTFNLNSHTANDEMESATDQPEMESLTFSDFKNYMDSIGCSLNCNIAERNYFNPNKVYLMNHLKGQTDQDLSSRIKGGNAQIKDSNTFDRLYNNINESNIANNSYAKTTTTIQLSKTKSISNKPPYVNTIRVKPIESQNNLFESIQKENKSSNKIMRYFCLSCWQN